MRLKRAMAASIAASTARATGESVGAPPAPTMAKAAAPLLLPGVGSALAALMVAVFDELPGVDGSVTRSVRVAVAPPARSPRLHVTVVVPEHVPCDAV